MGYIEWETAFNRQVEFFEAASMRVIETAAEDMLEVGIRQDTPKGNPEFWSYPAPANYVPGTLRAAWKMSKEGNVIVISNAIPYANRVEYGWSRQSPAGMMRRNVNQWQKWLDNAARTMRFR